MTRYRLQKWRNRAQSFINDIPVAICDWLFDPGSLTARLIKNCNGRFSVRVLSEEYSHARLGECRSLGMKNREIALIREVHLLCDDTPVVYARTIIPISTLVGAQKRLRYLGSKSLGAVLFADKSMRRSEVEVARLKAFDVKIDEEFNQKKDSTIWGRRSIFSLGGKPLMVSEYFLSTLVEKK